MTRLILPLLMALGALQAGAASPPNIVFFFIDDLGWSDLGYMGSTYYETSNIDRLARQGVVFRSAYANAPNCAPSRACLMSGQYGPRHGIYTVGDPERGNHPYRKLVPTPNQTVLAPRFVTLAEALQAGGYTTASMGKVKELHAAMQNWREQVQAPVPTQLNPRYDPQAVAEQRWKKNAGKKKSSGKN